MNLVTLPCRNHYYALHSAALQASDEVWPATNLLSAPHNRKRPCFSSSGPARQAEVAVSASSQHLCLVDPSPWHLRNPTAPALRVLVPEKGRQQTDARYNMRQKVLTGSAEVGVEQSAGARPRQLFCIDAITLRLRMDLREEGKRACLWWFPALLPQLIHNLVRGCHGIRVDV